MKDSGVWAGKSNGELRKAGPRQVWVRGKLFPTSTLA